MNAQRLPIDCRDRHDRRNTAPRDGRSAPADFVRNPVGTARAGRWPRAAFALLFAGGLMLGVPALAESPEPASDPQAPADEAAEAAPPKARESETPSRPSLGSLLRPRSTRPYSEAATPRGRGERDRTEWQQAFADARQEIATIEARLEAARTKVAEVSGGSAYQYSPLGGTEGQGPSDPEVLKLRAQMKRDKEELDAAESRFRDLQVEASLAGVPADWIESIKQDP